MTIGSLDVRILHTGLGCKMAVMYKEGLKNSDKTVSWTIKTKICFSGLVNIPGSALLSMALGGNLPHFLYLPVEVDVSGIH